MNNELRRAIIYGGNGFVGTHVAEKLVAEKAQVICISRTGNMPIHLQQQDWAQQVQWLKGDASQPDLQLLANADVLITVVGSPPLPTLTSKAHQKQVFTNGITNANAIDGAAKAGIKRVVLLSAKIPSPLRADWFGYAKGKRLSFEAARAFSEISGEHSAVVIKPGGIYGKRHTASGRQIPIDLLMRPLSKIMPSQLLSVDRVAACIARTALINPADAESLQVIEHADI